MTENREPTTNELFIYISQQGLDIIDLKVQTM